jgi:hypothetical protein
MFTFSGLFAAITTEAQPKYKYVAMYGNSEDTIRAVVAKLQSELGAMMFVSEEHTIAVFVESFCMKIFRKDSLIYITTVSGNRFSDQQKEEIRIIKGGDNILFHRIYCRNPNGRVVWISPLEKVVLQ